MIFAVRLKRKVRLIQNSIQIDLGRNGGSGLLTEHVKILIVTAARYLRMSTSYPI